MFEGIQKKLAERRAIAELAKNPLLAMGRDAIRAWWLDQPQIREQHSKNFVDNVAAQLLERVVQVATAPDPLAANREQLVGMTFAAAGYQVLVLDPPPTKDVTGLRGRLGITGELRAHLRQLGTVDPDLANELHGIPPGDDPEPEYGLCLLRYRQCFAAMHVHHMLRFGLDDRNRNAALDWFKPMFLVQCALAECNYRLELELPPTLDPIEALEYSTLSDFVSKGEKWPDLAWERYYEKKLPRMV